jgi:ribonuclease HI
VIHIDGAARGNPGPAAFAFTIAAEDGAVVEESGCLGRTTNNVAEYTALVRALERAAQLGPAHLDIYSDSELLVKQMNGQYQVKNPDLQNLYRQAKRLSSPFASVTLSHVPRARNSRADQLCNEALDGQLPSASPKRALAPPKTPPERDAREEGVRADAVGCLRAVAAEWARGNTTRPSPEEVWEQLWTILEDHQVLRPRGKGR